MMDNLAAFAEEATKMEEALKSAATPQHVCFMGADEKDDLLGMVVARMLQRHMAHVTIVRGGYRALYTYLSKRGQVDRLLEGMDVPASSTVNEDPLLEVPVEAPPQPSPTASSAGGDKPSSKLGRLLRSRAASSPMGSRENISAFDDEVSSTASTPDLTAAAASGAEVSMILEDCWDCDRNADTPSCLYLQSNIGGQWPGRTGSSQRGAGQILGAEHIRRCFQRTAHKNVADL